jgi:N-acetylmuramic acid 6-phosphate (MurNAc-6-P) etherase
MQPISERVNNLTRNLDVVGPRGIVRLLRQCDTQIFAGWEEWSGMSDIPTLESLENLADSILPQIRSKTSPNHPCNVKFIMSGAGTSGRLAFYIARNLNKV